MQELDDLKAAVAATKAVADSVVAKITELLARPVGNVDPAELVAIKTQLEDVNVKLTAAAAS